MRRRRRRWGRRRKRKVKRGRRRTRRWKTRRSMQMGDSEVGQVSMSCGINTLVYFKQFQ